jgi:ATP-dependent DNA ligase
VAFPLKTDLSPMEALSVEAIPEGREWQYEPKWDGFRCLAFRDGGKMDLRSKSGQPLARYFPDVVAAVLALKAKRCVLDGEIVIPTSEGLSFDDLLQRIHPAESRVQKLAKATPAWLIVFDLLADETGDSLVAAALSERRDALEEFAAKFFAADGTLRLSPATRDLSVAKAWFGDLGGNLDGVIAKRVDVPYASGERTGMVKIKRQRTADCVIGGFRYAEKVRVVGSLLLGLYDAEGKLHHVGFCSGLKASERAGITKKLEKLAGGEGFTGRAPGGPSRWSTKRSTEWQPLAPELVVEVSYDHVTGERFRHGTRLVRWRPDKDPRQCTMDQLAQKSAKALELLKTPSTKSAKKSKRAAKAAAR